MEIDLDKAINRWPAGSPGGVGGQFAPANAGDGMGGGSGGGGAPQFDRAKALSRLSSVGRHQVATLEEKLFNGGPWDSNVAVAGNPLVQVARANYNALRMSAGLERVKDWTAKPAVTLTLKDDAAPAAKPAEKTPPFVNDFKDDGYWPPSWSKPSGSLFGPQFGGGMPPKPKGPAHPKPDDKGNPIHIAEPSQPSAPSTWTDPGATATFVPGSTTPAKLHGVAFSKWTPPKDAEGWNKVSGQNPALDAADPIQEVKGKVFGAGVIIEEPDGRVWVVKPTNQFGGYANTFPKGTQDAGMSLQASAIKETWEETGLKVRLTGLLGDFERSQSVARYYIGKREGGTPSDMGWESQAVRLAPKSALGKLLNAQVDKDILEAYTHETSLGASADTDAAKTSASKLAALLRRFGGK